MTQTKAELLQTRHQGDLKLGDADSSHYVGFKAPATVSSSLVWILPAADGSSNQFLKTDGSGNLSWATDSATDSTKMPLAGGIFTGDVTFTGASANIVFDKSDNSLEFADNAKATFGASSDLEIYHSSSNAASYIQNSTGDLHIEAPAGSSVKLRKKGTAEVLLEAISDGAVELYHNNVKTFETTSTGAKVISSGSSHGLTLFHSNGNEVAALIHGGSGDEGHLLLKDSGTSTVVMRGELGTDIDITTGGNFDLQHDSAKLRMGAGNDLQLYHQGSNSYLQNDTGHLLIKNDTTASDVYVRLNGNEQSAAFIKNGGVELYYNDVKKIETTAQAVKITGGIAQVVTAAGALELDLNTSNYFTKTISGNSTFTFANPAASGQVTAFTLELTHSSGTVTWPSSVKWNADTAPTLTTGKTHLFMFVTDDGGTRYRGSALVDYVN